MGAQQSPRVVIAARDKMIAELAEIGGSRLTGEGKEQIADWLISSGYLADSYFDDVAAELPKAAG